MNTRLSKLVSFYRDACDPELAGATYCAELSTDSLWTRVVSKDYSSSTLRRLVFSREPETRRAAVWGLGWIGHQSEYRFLGPILRASDPKLRFEADRAREQLLLRTRTDWHVEFAQQIEESMAEAHWKSASRMVDRLVARHGEHPQSWLLRVSIRLCTSELLGAIEDCRYLLSFDRDSYRACVFLGQCYWFMNRLQVSKECFLEATRIYPDCTTTSLGVES